MIYSKVETRGRKRDPRFQVQIFCWPEVLDGGAAAL
jgi:hypothetical protein